MTRSSPFVLIALAVAAGIWLASQFPIPLWFSALVLVVSFAVAIGAWRSGASSEVVWLAAWVTLFTFGMLRYTLSAPLPDENSIARYNGQRVVLEGLVVDEPDVRPAFTNLRVKPQRVVSNATFDDPLSGLVLIRSDNMMRWRYGDVVRADGMMDAPPRLNTFDYRDYLARQGVFSRMSRPETLQRIGEGQGVPSHALLLDIKDAVRQTVNRVLPAPESALLNGILIGDDNAIPESLKEAFRRTGTSHIVAISGFNVSIVIALVVALLSRMLDRRRVATIAIPAIVLYTIFVGASASVQRAAVMAIIGLVGWWFWRRGFTLNTLCAAAFLMLVVDPNALFDVGFQLSFMATLGLVLYADRLSNPVHEWVQLRVGNHHVRLAILFVIGGVLVTLAAQITTLPLVLTTYDQLSLVALLTNAVVLPLQPSIMILGAVTAFIGLFLPASTDSILAWPVYAFLTITIRIVEWTSSLSLAVVPVYDFGTATAIACYAALLIVTAIALQPPTTRRAMTGLFRSRFTTAVTMCVAFVVIVLGGMYWFQRPDGKLRVTFNTGHVLVQTPLGKQIVFAGSGDMASTVGRAMSVWDRDIEMLILPRRDHYSRDDTLPLLQRYRIGTIILPNGTDEPSDVLDAWTRAAQANANRVITVPIGSRIELEPGVIIHIELRAPSRGGQTIGTQLTYGATELQLAGDATVVRYAPNQDVIFIGPRTADVRKLNESKPRWVIWADTGGSPPQISERGTRIIDLRAVKQITMLSDGEQLAIQTN